jgi:hypothetical protein
MVYPQDPSCEDPAKDVDVKGFISECSKINYMYNWFITAQSDVDALRAKAIKFNVVLSIFTVDVIDANFNSTE